MATTDYLLKKYASIIQEEVNVKEVTLLGADVQVEISYIPLGQALGQRFGKDTSRIIAAAKSGHATLQPNGELLVEDMADQRLLVPGEYEVRRSGLQEDHQTIEEGVVVSLDMTITQELKDEGVAREISRFLNQMRKDADYRIDAKVNCFRQTQSRYIAGILDKFGPLLQQEALLQTIEKGSSPKADLTSTFENEGEAVTFQVVK